MRCLNYGQNRDRIGTILNSVRPKITDRIQGQNTPLKGGIFVCPELLTADVRPLGQKHSVPNSAYQYAPRNLLQRSGQAGLATGLANL